ncbi:glycoside hydrolase family 76 protein [Sclerotinia borealis F-4128]|uniref:Glycoside hydrolase family 76 protein n=1 Tax=Sclerotinia borealis (strain F-4128) TaxID=1432307 RepID=W9CNX1_SCLBF|nr:glycoside hydrolase family 76 protein [Sclerotinia borealis F-4128]
MMHRSFVSLCFILGLADIATSQQYTSNSESAFKQLQTWYDTTSGLWSTTGWWNSANCLTVIGDLAAIDPNVKSTITGVMSNTFIQAQKYNLQMTKAVMANYNYLSMYGNSMSALKNVDLAKNIPVHAATTVNPKGFLNDYYDDEGWWALGWIQAYDVTGNNDYLTMAVDIFADMKNGSTTPCSNGASGIWWDKSNSYVNAIANELYLSVAAHLANRATGYGQEKYLTIAKKQWNWFQGTGIINAQGTINDGLTTACQNNNGTVWSYNQGVILGGLVELSTATGKSSYLTSANRIATAAINALSDSNGILHDSCEPNCGADGAQFKGVFMRNLQRLYQASPDSNYLNLITNNAKSIWANDRDPSNNALSINWAGPFIAPANASTHSSAMDALVAADAVGGAGTKRMTWVA